MFFFAAPYILFKVLQAVTFHTFHTYIIIFYNWYSFRFLADNIYNTGYLNL